MKTEEQVLARLRLLRAGTTMCPGQLAVSLGCRLPQLRSTLTKMAQAGQIVLSQRGHAVDPDDLKGPFRVALGSRPP